MKKDKNNASFWREGGIIGISGGYFWIRQHHTMAMVCLVLLVGLIVYRLKGGRL